MATLTRRRTDCRLRLRDERGQALVEFAMVVPIFALLLFGLIELGRAWMAHQVLTNAARDGARTAVMAGPTVSADSVHATIRRALQASALSPEGLTVTVEGLNAGAGTPLTVRVWYPYKFMMAGPWGGTDGSVTLSTASVMRNE